MGRVDSMLLQVQLDGMHLKVSVFHQLQYSFHQPQQTQELVGWFVCSYFVCLDLTQADSTWIHICSSYSLPKSNRNLTSMYTRHCVGQVLTSSGSLQILGWMRT